jgi:hypothetical protein
LADEDFEDNHEAIINQVKNYRILEIDSCTELLSCMSIEEIYEALKKAINRFDLDSFAQLLGIIETD